MAVCWLSARTCSLLPSPFAFPVIPNPVVWFWRTGVRDLLSLLLFLVFVIPNEVRDLLFPCSPLVTRRCLQLSVADGKTFTF
jgi:hypothetical protein